MNMISKAHKKAKIIKMFIWEHGTMTSKVQQLYYPGPNVFMTDIGAGGGGPQQKSAAGRTFVKNLARGLTRS